MKFMKNIWSKIKTYLKRLFNLIEEEVDDIKDGAEDIVEDVKQDASSFKSKSELSNLTKAELVNYAEENFDEKISLRHKKAEIIEKVFKLQ